MKKHILFLALIFPISLFFIACPLGCEPGSESQALSGTSEILLTPQQEKYNLTDELSLTIKYSSAKNVYERILLKTSAEIYSPTKEKYVSTDNIILHNKDSEENLINESYVLSDSDNSSGQTIEKNLLIQAKSAGVYRISVFLLGCKNDSDIADYDSEYFYIKFQ